MASPQTQIAFRGIAPALLGAIRVSGSASGVHSGKIVDDSDGDGASFIPAQPFKPGETVTVSTSLTLVGAPNGTYQFRVAVPAARLVRQALPIARWKPGYTLSYHSRPDLRPPAVRIKVSSGRVGGADIFLTPQYGPLQNGPMIVDPRGRLVWFMPVPHGDLASDLRVQTYAGTPFLTWWQGYSGSGAGAGIDEIYNTSYRLVATVHAANGLSADLHEFQFTPRGTALITAYYPVHWDARSVGGRRNQVVFDCVVQEIDIPTGLVLFQWDSLDHVPLSASYSRLPKGHGPFDYFHVNSVAEDSDGNLIISGRNTWAAYKVKRSSGSIMWTLGGKHSSFRLGRGASFAFQHDVRVRAAGDRLITMFDDGAGPPTIQRQSRALELSLNMRHMTADRTAVAFHTPAVSANFEGNVQQLPNFDYFIGWGQQPFFSEYDPHGNQILDGRFLSDTSSYRAYRFNWSATPASLPSVVAKHRSRGTVVYVSWNGATNVASWGVDAGDSSGQLRRVTKAQKNGFETAIGIPHTHYVRVEALSANGSVLATSPTIAVS